MATSRSMENRSERTLLRLPELMSKHGDTIVKAEREIEIESEREIQRLSRANPSATLREQNLLISIERSIRQQHRISKAARRASRRAMNAMKKTVEITDGGSDFSLLMAAAFGKGIMRSWKFARTVFEDVTGLQLIQETEDDEDSCN